MRVLSEYSTPSATSSDRAETPVYQGSL